MSIVDFDSASRLFSQSGRLAQNWSVNKIRVFPYQARVRFCRVVVIDIIPRIPPQS